MPRGRKSGTAKKAGTARKAGAAKKTTAAKRGGVKRIEPATKATFGVDDKRAQYARLVVFNHAVKTKQAPAKSDVNSVSNAVLEKAGKDMNSGNMLHGKGGVEIIQDLSKKGATDEKVAERGLTTAYAQEVHPFIKRLQFAESFGRRGRKAAAEPQEEEAAA
jgi:hypothetical protein